MPKSIPQNLKTAIENFRSSNPSSGKLQILQDILGDFQDGESESWLENELRSELSIAPIIAAHHQAIPQRPTSHAANGGQLNNISKHLTAAYRFIAFDPSLIVKAEAEALEPINLPKRAGLNAEIIVHWTAKTPLLVGDQKEGGVEPLKIGNTWSIPGSTLRGAIRSVSEIIGGARLALAHVNHSQVFALRDFTHAAYASDSENDGYPIGVASAVKAGWLIITPSDDKSDAALFKASARIEQVSHWYKTEVTSDQKGQDLARKYGGKRLTTGSGANEIIVTAKTVQQFTLSAGSTGKLQGDQVTPHKSGPVAGHYVFSDSGPPMKDRQGNLIDRRWEYVFATNNSGGAPEAFDIDAAIWQRFVRLHARSVGDKLRPLKTWGKFTKMVTIDNSIKIPIFYVGDLADQNPKTLAFGLTRLFRAPHKWSLDEVMAASGVKNPIDGESVDLKALDMVDALYGFVYELPEKSEDPNKPSELSRRGRVAFSAASLLANSPAQTTEIVRTVEGGPQPTFAPFYLQGAVPDYSAQVVPQIAGRKRYPVRAAGSDFNSIKGRLSARAQGLNAGAEVFSNLKFLVPAQNVQLVFRSIVRLTNVTKAELGLIINAITLGGQAHLRHAIGRAKNEGAGQMKAEIKGLTVEYLAEKGVIETTDYSAFMTALDNHVSAMLGAEKLNKFKAIQAGFYHCCDPSQWTEQKLKDNAALRNGGNFKAEGFKQLRDATKRHKEIGKQSVNRPPFMSLMDARKAK